MVWKMRLINPAKVSSVPSGSSEFIFYLEIPEKTQVKALKYLTRVRRESNELHEMISK
jgi:hypothetical protein